MTQLTIWRADHGIVIIGLCLLMGYAGQISLGHAAFFAIGGYTNAVLTTLNLDTTVGFAHLIFKLGLTVTGTDMYGGYVISVSPVVALVCAIVISGRYRLSYRDTYSQIERPLSCDGDAWIWNHHFKYLSEQKYSAKLMVYPVFRHSISSDLFP